MNIYKITTKPEWSKTPQYHGGNTIRSVFANTNEEFQSAIIKIETVETGLSENEIYRHKLPMSYSYE